MTIFTQAFISNRKHLLATLLSLEGLMLSIFFILSMCTLVKSYALYQMVFLTLVACEGALGLTLLMSIVRTHGGDCFNSMNSLKC
uniref:NADH-ubiquinone oxidoreductase chain 4L n=1 Tax=Polyphemus pediculus TaxID=77662 RepID=A0A7M4C8S5_9CRUS|nr:NADH dehydrogenase subunit 4L [Polyphemus pediculus]